VIVLGDNSHNKNKKTKNVVLMLPDTLDILLDLLRKQEQINETIRLWNNVSKCYRRAKNNTTTTNKNGSIRMPMVA
jgi:protoporphyrinogen oxidase